MFHVTPRSVLPRFILATMMRIPLVSRPSFALLVNFCVLSILIHCNLRQPEGLLREDLYMEERPEVEEAIRRLPEEEQYERLFRIKRALDLSMKKAILPHDQWTTPEQVWTPSAYLFPYLTYSCFASLMFYSDSTSTMMVWMLAPPFWLLWFKAVRTSDC